MRTSAPILTTLLLAATVAGCLAPGGDGPPDGVDDPVGPNLAGPAGPASPQPVTAERDEDEAHGGFSDTDVFPGDYEVGGPYSKVLVPGPYDALDPEVVTLSSDVDGAAISMQIVRPDVPADVQVPVILQASPYYERLQSTPSEPAGGLDRPYTDRYYVEPLLRNFVPHGYAVVLLALRGTANSGGCWDTLGPKTGADLDQAITFLGEAEWSTGNVGLIGLSQDGFAAWQAASLGNPHVRTIVPIAGAASMPDTLFRNGTWAALGAMFPLATFGLGLAESTDPPNTLEEAQASAGRVVCPEVAEGMAASAAVVATGEPDPFGFWEARDLADEIEATYDGSVFAVHGLQDATVDPAWVYPWVTRLEASGVPTKHLLGQWGHWYPDQNDATPRWDFAEVLLHWFDHWLKGDTGVDLGPRAQVADQTGAWRSEATWPPADAVRTPYYLTADGTLEDEPAGEEALLLVGPDPVQYAHGRALGLYTLDGPCAACQVFTLGPVEEELRFAGLARPHLTVVPSGPGGHLTADLFVVTDDDSQRVTTGHMDLRSARGDGGSRTVVPGEPIVARMELAPADVVVPAGSSLVLVVSQGSPSEDATWYVPPSVPSAPVQVQVGGVASVLTLPIIERGPDAFFEPP